MARYHDRVAHQYDDIYDDVYWQWHDALTWSYLKPHLPSVQREPIIDLGCGTAKWGLKIARSGFCVTCVDISEKMVETVRRKAAALGLSDRVAALQADLLDLAALPPDHFALAVAMGEPLCAVDSPPRALKQIHRVLKNQALLIATVDNRLGGLDYYLERGDIDQLQDFLRTGRTHWLTREPAERFALHTYTPRQLSKLLSASRFELLEIRGKTVLPMRRYRELLQNRVHFRKLLRLETRLARDADAMGRASHYQFVARKQGDRGI